MASGSFFAFLDRMKYISRWGLMRGTVSENVQEHSMQVSILAHVLAIIGRDVFGKELNPDFIACAALYHDCSEIITGDMPTPIKYLNRELTDAYKAAEKDAKDRLFSTLPPELQKSYDNYIYLEEKNPSLYAYIKAADKLSAYMKCLTERKSGNTEFKFAEKTLRDMLDSIATGMEELKYFMDKLLSAYMLTLDEL